MKTIAALALFLVSQISLGYTKGDILTVNSDIKLKFGSQASWCPSYYVQKISGKYFFDFKSSDGSIDTYNLKTLSRYSNKSKEINIQVLAKIESAVGEINLRKNQKVQILEVSRGNKLEMIGSLGECGRYYLIRLSILDRNNKPTGDEFTVGQIDHADAKLDDIKPLDYLSE